MKHRRYWAIGIVLVATVGFIALQNVTAPAINEAPLTQTITDTSTIIATDTPIATLAYEGCGYMWAYHDSPGLTEKINTAVRDMNSNATARAQLFGEDCVYADGSSTFGVMETDFYVQLPVDTLADQESFGNWMAKVLSFITQIPEQEMQRKYGFVEFSFIKTETEQIAVRATIYTYINEASGKSGGELFQFFYNPPANPT